MRKLFLVLLLLLPVWAYCQDVVGYFNHKRQKINKTGMIVLGSWATGNIGVNGYLWSKASGSTKHFHEMNTYWNIVNLGIAGFGYFKSAKEDFSDYDLEESMHAQAKSERIYLINGVLDVGYIITGVYLQSVRQTHPEKERLTGYGQAIFWQGIFLVAFDSVMFLVHHGNKKNSGLILEDFSFNGTSVGVRFAF